MSQPTPNPPLMRSLGQFVGHIWQGIKNDPSSASPPAGTQPPAAGTAVQAASREIMAARTHEEIRDTPNGKVVVRRTVIEEIETLPLVPPPSGPAQQPAQDPTPPSAPS